MRFARYREFIIYLIDVCRSELLPRDDWFKELKSDINQLKDNFTQNQAVTREELSLVTSNIASLQKRVELIDTRFEKVIVNIC